VVIGVAPLMGLMIDRLLLRRLEGASTSTSVVASLGLLVALQASAVALYGGATRPFAALFPTRTYRLPGVNVGIDQTIVVGVALAAGVGLAAFFRHVHLGLQTRAVVGDRELTELMGTNSRLVTTLSWMLGCSFAALSGILLSPFTNLDSLLLTLLVIQAAGAAVVGRLRGLSATTLGAYGIGIGAAVLTKLVATNQSLIGLPSSLPFIVLFVALVMSRKGTFQEVTGTGGLRGRRAGRQTRMPWRSLVVWGGVAALLPAVLSGSRLSTATTTLAFVLVFGSLSLLVGLSRQVSLCHAVFVVFGATTLSHLLAAGVPYVAALVLAALVVVPVGALLAIPAIRLSGLFLALATFGFGVLAQNLLFNTGLAFGRDAQALVPRPSAFEGDTGFYYFVLAVVVVGTLAVEVVRVSRLGRLLRGMADSPTAVESIGIDPTASRVLVFCLAAFLAALAGGLLGSQVRFIAPASFDFYQSLVWLTVLVAAGAMTFGGAVLGALLFVAVPAVFTSGRVTEWQPVAFGVGAMLLAQAPNGLVGALRWPDVASRRASSRRASVPGNGPGSLERRRHQERYAGAVLARGATGP
jgi:ABC-type branched-subunit amino acid transport system permease subunit